MALLTDVVSRASDAPHQVHRPRRDPDWRVLLLGVLVVSALYVAWHLSRGWVPHDEGALGQSAIRIMRGELPHRDFDELYTGGLSYLNAAAFRLFGTTLLSMRLVLFVAFLAWIPAVFYVASRLVQPLAAAGVTLLCVAWTLPNYPAPLPSWYNLFLAIVGLAALFRWLEDPRRRWLVAAGLAGGLSLLVKVVGLYQIAGALLFFVFQAQVHSRASSGGEAKQGRGYALFVTLCLLVFCAALVLVVRREIYAAGVVHFIVPGMLVAGLLIRNEWSEPSGTSWERARALVRLMLPYLAGVALPVLLFLIPFVLAHAVGALLDGVFVLPTKRFGFAATRMLSLLSMLALVPAWLLIAYGRRITTRTTPYHAVALAVGLASYLWATGSVALLYRVVWYAARGAPPLLVLIGVSRLWRAREADEEESRRRSRIMLLLGATAVFTLVQFPFSVPIYFCYVAPLVALLAVALLPRERPIARPVVAALVAFLTAFAVLRTNTSPLFGMGTVYRSYPPTARLAMPRAGLRVLDYEAVMYDSTVAVLREHARGGFTWASPDCPEIYFLSGLRNPTGTLFDFFDDPDGRTARILSTLDRHGVTAIVLNNDPQFSAKVSGDLAAALQARYPFSIVVGRFQKFQVRWQ